MAHAIPPGANRPPEPRRRPAVSLAKPTQVASVVPLRPGPEPAQGEPTAPPKRRAVAFGRAVWRIARHERTRTAGRLAVRHGMYVAGGVRITARRVWNGRTAARYERMMEAAVAAGLHEQAADWEERAQRFRQQRHQRRMDLLTAPAKLARATAVTAATGAGILLAVGAALAWATGDPAHVLTPVHSVVTAVYWAAVIVGIVWGPALALGPWLALSGLWAVGRHAHTAPAWALPAQQRPTADADAPITPSVVVTALRDLGIAPLTKAIKGMGDHGAQMLSPIVIAGCGVEVDVTLPSGVTTEEVQAKRRKLAENLNRHEHEVFPTLAPNPRTIRLWIADSGALDEPIGPSPLATDPDATADYKSGRAPWGQNLRGESVLISTYQRHFLCTGLSNQGKTASLRAVALWLALDPTVEFWIGDLKGVGDWGMFDGLASRLIQGPTDEHVAEVTEMVEDAAAEMDRRILAPAGTRFTPLIVVVDEAQVAFMCPAVGDDKRPYGGTKATSRYFHAVRKIHNQGRAVDVLLWQGTQDPTDQNLPKIVREGAHTRASLVVGTESQARMAVGDKAVDGGAAPHLLRQGLDKGTLVVAGDAVEVPTGQASVTVRTHYIDDTAAEEIAQRAKHRRGGLVTTAGPTGEDRPDPLADIAAVIGDAKRMRTEEVRQRLAERDPRRYREWTAQQLAAVLDAAGAPIRKSDGVKVVSREKVHAALAARDTTTSGIDGE